MGWTQLAVVVFRSVLVTLANVCNVAKLLTWRCVEVEARIAGELIPNEGVVGRDLAKVAGVLWGHGGALRISCLACLNLKTSNVMELTT